MKLKLASIILLLAVSSTFVSCGNKLKVSLPSSQDPHYEYIRPFAMSTNEKLLESHPVIKEIDLHDSIAELDTLPIERESFQRIYDLLKVDQSVYSKYVVLKKTPECQALIGYCKAYYIQK